jgi:Holliday junction resolvase
MYTRGSGRKLIQDIVAWARGLGYEVTREPHVFWGRHQPDLIIRKGGKRIVIEAKMSPIALSHVAQLKRVRADKVIIFTSSDAFASTAASVLDYAAQVGVQICPAEAIDAVIEELEHL